MVGLEFGQTQPTVRVTLAEGVLRFGDSVLVGGGEGGSATRDFDVRVSRRFLLTPLRS